MEQRKYIAYWLDERHVCTPCWQLASHLRVLATFEPARKKVSRSSVRIAYERKVSTHLHLLRFWLRQGVNEILDLLRLDYEVRHQFLLVCWSPFFKNVSSLYTLEIHTLEDIWGVKLVWIPLFRHWDLWADLQKIGT